MQLEEHAVPGQIVALECRIRARAVEANHAGWAVSAERLSSATPDSVASMEAVGYPGLAGAPGSMPLLVSCLVLNLLAVVSGMCRENAGHDGL
jgi:hypothetical protein